MANDKVKTEIEAVMEMIYQQVYEAGGLCRGCVYNKVTENPSDIGDGTAYELLRECNIEPQNLHDCPGVRLFVSAVIRYSKEKAM